MAATTRERNYLEALLHGWAVLLVAVAATFALVLALMLVSGCELAGQHFVMPIAGLCAAGACSFLAHLARTPT